jgi:hypothetical protein
MDDGLIKKVLSTIRCGVCGQYYQSSNIEVLAQRGEMWFLSLFCPVCASRSLVAAIIKENDVPEIITDLSEAEYAKFSQGDAVMADDVLDIHESLKDFHGDISELLRGT